MDALCSWLDPLLRWINALDHQSGLGSLRLPNRVRAVHGAERRILAILNSHGGVGTLIVPVSVLEEAERVASRNRHRYQQALRTLHDISVRPERIPWISFSFERLTLDVLAAFLHLHEALDAGVSNSEQWPDFGDALVLAHGLHHGCPVLSMEWQEKHDWDTVRGLFEWLVFS